MPAPTTSWNDRSLQSSGDSLLLSSQPVAISKSKLPRLKKLSTTFQPGTSPSTHTTTTSWSPLRHLQAKFDSVTPSHQYQEPAAPTILPYRIQLLHPQDSMQEIHSFHERMFPVRYNSQFYDDLRKAHVAAFLARCTDSGQLIAMATGRVTVEAPSLPGDSSSSSSKMGYIMTLGVVPEWRRRGLATALLKQLIPRLFELGAERLELDVITYNQTALQLYQRHGFQVERILQNYYLIDGQYHDSYHLVFPACKLGELSKRSREEDTASPRNQ